MRLLPLLAGLLLLDAAYAGAQVTGPFSASVSREETGDGTYRLIVNMSVPEGNFLYADKVTIGIDADADAVLRESPKPEEKTDPFLGETVKVFAEDVSFVYALPRTVSGPFSVRIDFQGCSDTLCFPPETVTLRVGADGDAVKAQQPPTNVDAAATLAWKPLADRFLLAARETGYMRPQEMLDFLGSAQTGEGLQADGLQGLLARKGFLAVVAFILVGGLLLNLTPCVLPMIPVNIAIIGAGAAAGSKVRGFVLGGAYGVGMAIVYGGLGLLVVLTGSKFGSLNSSPWFNLGIALVFIVLTLAMLDVISIDLSRLQTRSKAGAHRGSVATALVLGGVAALLAGACVAPVLISVLLLATDLYVKGNVFGLVLPFLLGIGMALPWPLAGAGLSVLPKPGQWMSKVKYLFALLMIGFSIYYGKLGFSLLDLSSKHDKTAVTENKAGWHTSLEEGLAEAQTEQKPVFIDMWASWCKNCGKMDETTFRDKEVQSQLEAYVKIRYRAEDLGQAETKAAMDYFGAIGLPTYVVLLPSPQK